MGGRCGWCGVVFLGDCQACLAMSRGKAQAFSEYRAGGGGRGRHARVTCIDESIAVLHPDRGFKRLCLTVCLPACLPVCLHASTPPASSSAGLADSHVLHMVFVSCFFIIYIVCVCTHMHAWNFECSLCASILTAFFPYFCLYLHFICANYTYSIAASVSAAVVVAISTSIHVYIYIFT